MAELFTIERNNEWFGGGQELRLNLRPTHDAIVARLKSPEHKVYILPIHMNPDELDDFIASKITHWIKNSIRVVIGEELAKYSSLSKTRKQLTKRLLRNDVIVKIHSDL